MSNSVMKEVWPRYEMYATPRKHLMSVLSDGDLSFSPGGSAPTFGELCREIGEVQQAYIDSFKQFKQDFEYRHPDPTIATSVARLTAWYDELDAEMQATIAAISEDDIQNKIINRGEGFQVPVGINLGVFIEAMLIFYGKAMIYLRITEHEFPEGFEEWIG